MEIKAEIVEFFLRKVYIVKPCKEYMTKFQCRVCNFKFESQYLPKECPYCSKVGSVRPVPQASDILNEIDRDEKRKMSEGRETE